MQRKKFMCSTSNFYLSQRYYDTSNIINAIEEEFDLEISVKWEDILSWNVGQLVNLVMQKIEFY